MRRRKVCLPHVSCPVCYEEIVFPQGYFPEGSRKCPHCLVEDGPLFGYCAKCGVYPVPVEKHNEKYLCEYCARKTPAKGVSTENLIPECTEPRSFEYDKGCETKRSTAKIPVHSSGLEATFRKEQKPKACGSYGSFKIYINEIGETIGIKKCSGYSSSLDSAERDTIIGCAEWERCLLTHLYGDFFCFRHCYMREERNYPYHDQNQNVNPQYYWFDRAYITMPYCKGTTLSKYFGELSKTNLNLTGFDYFCEICKIFYTLSLTIKRNHTPFRDMMAISHNDIKGDNVIVNVEGDRYKVYLLDYGLARDFDTPIFNLPLPPPGEVVNTIPPEFFTNCFPRPMFICHIHDIYMLCVMFIHTVYFILNPTLSEIAKKEAFTMPIKTLSERVLLSLQPQGELIVSLYNNIVSAIFGSRGDYTIDYFLGIFIKFLYPESIPPRKESLIALGYSVEFPKNPNIA